MGEGQGRSKESQIVIRLDKISLEDNKTAYAYYTANSSLFDMKAPAVKLEYNKGIWRFNTLISLFSMDLDEKKYWDKIEESLDFLFKTKDNATGLLRVKADILNLKVPPKYKEFHKSLLNIFDKVEDYYSTEEKMKYLKEIIEIMENLTSKVKENNRREAL